MSGMPKAPRLDFDVTDEIIEFSKDSTRDSSHCMTAEGLKRAFPHLKNIAVDIATIRGTDAEKGLRYTWLTPHHVQQAIIAFDRGETPPGFRVRLRNGMVFHSRANPTPRVMTDKQKEALSAAREAQKERLKHPQLVQRNPHSIDGLEHSQKIPDRVGGKPPPSIGLRRAYGIQAFDRIR